VRIFLIPIIGISLILSALSLFACTNSDSDLTNEKISSQLLTQVNLRKEQISNPAPDRLDIMKNMGMSVDNLGIQRIFIHSEQELAPPQIEELEAIGIILYLDSWIPAVGAHPTGFIIADMPVDKLETLVKKNYIARLETAERQLRPQNGVKPQ